MKSLLLITLLICAALCFAESGFGVSDAFTMDTVDPIVEVSNPTLGQEVLSGDTLPITWTSVDSNVVPNCINLYWRPDPVSEWNQIAQNQPDNGLYLWMVDEPETEDAQVRIRMRDAFGNLGYGYSDPFNILPPTEPRDVHITSYPSGAQVFIDGVSTGFTPYIATIEIGQSYTVTVQKFNYVFDPVSQFVEWMDGPQTIHFVGTYTGPGTLVTQTTIPDIWVLADSPYVIPEPIVITADRNIIMQDNVNVVNQTISPLPFYGSLTATNVTFRSEVDSLLWGGLQFFGSDSTRTISNLSGCIIHNALNPLLIRNSSPVIDSLQIAPVDSLMYVLNPGIIIEGNSAPQLNNVLITSYETGLMITATEPQMRDAPVLTNVRIRSSSSSLRSSRFPDDADPKAIVINGCSSASITDVDIVDYPLGIRVENDSLFTTSSPTLTNIRIRSSSSSLRTPTAGIELLGYQSTIIDDAQIYDSNYGIVTESDRPQYSASPTLTNVRIRSSSSSLRQISQGIIAGANSAPLIQNCKISEADFGLNAMIGSVPTFKNNTLKNCKTGVFSQSSQLPTLKGNLFLVEQSWAMQNPTVSYTGIQMSSNPNCLIENNSFYGYPMVLSLSFSSCLFQNNIAWHYGVLQTPFQRISSTITATYNDVFAGPNAYTGIVASNNLNINPQFRNLTVNDFHLHYNSPCIDAGNPTSATNLDGTRADMGAFPYLHKADFDLPAGNIEAGQNVTFVNTSIGHSEPVSIARWDLNNDSSIDSEARDWTTSLNTPGIYFLKLTMITGNITDHSPVRMFEVSDAMGLPAPANLQAMVIDNHIRISWDAVAGAHSYKVMASDDPFGFFVQLDGSAGVFSTVDGTVFWTAHPTMLNKRFYKIMASTQRD